MQPHTYSKPWLKKLQRVLAFPLGMLLLFVLISLSTLQPLSKWVYLDGMNEALHSFESATFLELMGWENPYFNKELPEDYHRISLPGMTLEAMTHINIKDERSLLGNELPGFSLFDTKIVVAGKGTNYTNVPVESPPPPKHLIKKSPGKSKKQGTTNPEFSQKAQIFFYNTHTWESYLPVLGKTGASNANLASTMNESKNVHMVDDLLINDLENLGVEAVQDRDTVTDYNTAYSTSRHFIQSAISSKKPYKLYLDIHRDSSRKINTTTKIKGQSFARLSIVIGSANPHAEENKALAKKLNTALGKKYPGLSKGIFEKSRAQGNGVYNQDLSPHALLIEIGGVDNTKKELERTADALAHILSAYVKQAAPM